MCFYGIIYLKIEGGKKRKIFVLAPHSSIPVRREVAVRPAIVLFENYSYLFILLGGQ